MKDHDVNQHRHMSGNWCQLTYCEISSIRQKGFEIKLDEENSEMKHIFILANGNLVYIYDTIRDYFSVT